MTFPVIPTAIPGESLSFRVDRGQLVLCLDRDVPTYGLQVYAAVLTREGEESLEGVLRSRRVTRDGGGG